MTPDALKSPICSFDAKTGVLCAKCEARLQSGHITQDDVEASTKLTRLADRSADVNKFTLVKGARVDGDFVLVLRGSDVLVLRANEGLAGRVGAEFGGGKVWFVEAEASDRRFIENLFHPVKILTVNLFWLPDGNKVTRAIAAGSAQKARIDVDKIQKIARAVRNIDLMVEFEQK